MDKNLILNEARKGLRSIIDSIELHNIEEKEGEITQHLIFLKSLNSIPSIPNTPEKSESEEASENLLDEIPVEDHPEESNKNCSDGSAESSKKIEIANPMFKFERKLRGGIVQEINGYIPESVVRSLGIENGDYVYAKEIPTTNPSRRHFDYSLAKEGERKGTPRRAQYNYCIVTKIAGQLAIDTYLDGSNKKNVLVDNFPYTLLLSEHEINYYSIKEGSIIDVSFWEKEPENHKIIWKHDTEKNESIIDKKTIQQIGKGKEEQHGLIDIEQTLEGKTVLVVGNEPKKAFYKGAIESRGGNFLFADAKDKVDSFESKIKKSDQVIFLLKVSGHTGMRHIKALCKTHEVPFDETWSVGTTTITRMAENA